MNNEDEPRRRRSSFQLLADAVGATDARVAPDDADARRRDAPDPTLTDDERAALEEAAESMRGELTKAKLIGPDLGSGGGKWGGGARAPDGRIYYAPLMARAVLCFDPATDGTLKNNPMDNDENQDVWDGRMRFIETRMSEVVEHRSARTERRVGEQIRELRAGMATEAQMTEMSECK